MFQAYSGIFTTLDILRDIFPHSGVFRQIQGYSESWHTYSMSPTLARYTSKHTTDATHASVPPTPSTLARIARHFSNTPKEKSIAELLMK